MQDNSDLELKEKFPDIVVASGESQGSTAADFVRRVETIAAHDGSGNNSSTDVSPAEKGTQTAPCENGGNWVGEYHLVELIAHGSCGDVWKAVNRTGGPVALKLFRKELLSNAEAIDRFHQEAKLLRRVSHPNIVSILDSGVSVDGAPYIVMELIDGQTIKSVLEQEAVFEPKRAATVAREICRALIAAHAETVIHRDLKPSNVLITRRQEVKLIDFGIAKATGYTGETLTQFGGIVGTPAYMSPEQCLGQLVDARSDIYALGCTMFEMLAGATAFSSNVVEAIAQHLNPDRSSIKRRLKSTGAEPAVQAIVMKCLERQPSARYDSVSQVEHDLSAYCLGARLRYTASSTRVFMLSASLLFATVLGLLCYLVQSRHLPDVVETPPPAERVPVAVTAPGPIPVIAPGPGVVIKNTFGKVLFSDRYARDLKQALVDAGKQRISLAYADLHGANLTLARIENLDLKYADLWDANLTGTSFINDKLNYANFRCSTLTQAKFNSTDLSYANFGGAKFGQARVNPDCACKYTNFMLCDMTQAHLDGVNVEYAKFSNANLTQTSLKHAMCANANFSGATLIQTFFQNADCRAAVFNGAELTQTFFQDADLRNAYFSPFTRGAQISGKDAHLDGSGLKVDNRGFLDH